MWLNILQWYLLAGLVWIIVTPSRREIARLFKETDLKGMSGWKKPLCWSVLISAVAICWPVMIIDLIRKNLPSNNSTTPGISNLEKRRAMEKFVPETVHTSFNLPSSSRLRFRSLVARIRSIFTDKPCWVDSWRGWHRGHQFICNKTQDFQFAFLFDWLKNDLLSELRTEQEDEEKAFQENHRRLVAQYGEVLYSRASRPSPEILISSKSAAFIDKTDNAPPPWFVGYTREFSSEVMHLDRKIQGRILEALMELSREPATPKGDTIKPLTADKKGFWRYRIGDFRLVYKPDRSKATVLAVSFSDRGSAYD